MAPLPGLFFCLYCRTNNWPQLVIALTFANHRWVVKLVGDLRIEQSNIRDVAQSGSVQAWGAWGRWFESSRPDKKKGDLIVAFFAIRE